MRLLLSRRSEENQSLVFGSSAVESAAKALLASIDTLGRMASNSELSGETSLFRQNVSPLVNVLPSDGVYRDTGGESGHRLKIIFVADGINSVGDYNSPPGGCRLSVCVCLCVSVCVSVCVSPLFFTFHDWITSKRFELSG